jgi:predicted ATPase
LRAATSLGRVWEQTGREEDGRRLLEPLYHAFTEGLQTADLREARALLDRLPRSTDTNGSEHGPASQS